MFDTSKRKNEDKAKGLPRRHLAVIIGLLILFAITLIGFAWRVLSYPNAAQPTGQIFYTHDHAPMMLNLQTGERGPYEPTPAPPYDPAARIDWNTSPDGKWHIKWVEIVPHNLRFYVILTNTETKLARAIGPIYGYNYAPGFLWSPDSRGIYFIAYTDPVIDNNFEDYLAEIWRINVIDLKLERLTSNTTMEHSIQISPDSTKLAYIAAPDGYSRLHILDVATGQSIMPAPDMYIFFGAWSPDSQWFAFETNHANGISDIWITRADGTETQGIALDPNAWERAPIWLP